MCVCETVCVSMLAIERCRRIHASPRTRTFSRKLYLSGGFYGQGLGFRSDAEVFAKVVPMFRAKLCQCLDLGLGFRFRVYLPEEQVSGIW